MAYADPNITFSGEWKDGEQHGQGSMTYVDGTCYTGEWKFGKRSGHGSVTGFDRRMIYTGEWLNGELVY